MRQLSHSQFQQFAGDTGCQLKWAFDKLWRVPQGPNEAAILGDAFHAALEADGNMKLMLDEGAPFSYLFNAAQARLDAELERLDRDGTLRSRRNNMLARLQAMLECYINHVQRFYKPSQKPETPFDLEVAGVKFTGKIDARGKAIIDWKQTKELINKWGKEWIDNPEHEDQATAYMIADPTADAVQFIVFACHPDRPTVCDLRKYTITRDEARQERYKARLAAAAAQMDRAVAEEKFDAHISPLCAWCNFIGVCDAGKMAMEAQGRAIAVTPLKHTTACECGGVAEALRYTFSDDRANRRVPSIVFLCKSCGCQFCRDVVKGKRHAEAKQTSAKV